MDHGSSVFIQVRVPSSSGVDHMMWYHCLLTQVQDSHLSLPYLPVPLACLGLNLSPAFDHGNWYPQFCAQVTNKYGRHDRTDSCVIPLVTGSK